VVVLGLCGFLIRSQQFVIIVFASLPFLNLKLLIRDKKFQFFCIALFVLILFAVSIDWLSYTGPEWNRFFEINRARAAYTDFGLTDQLKSHPSIIDAHGYTNNDLDLIRSFFFSDPLITKPEMLNSMSSQLGALPFFTANLPLAFAAIKSISSLNILPITLLACVLFVFRPSVRGATAFFFVVSFAFLMGLIGRGGLERVLLPLVTMLAIFSVINLCDCDLKARHFKLIDSDKLNPAVLIFFVGSTTKCNID
jgi:hypothetical protein